MCHLFDRSSRATISVYSSAWKHKLGRGRWDPILPVKFRWIPFSGFRGEVENVSVNQRKGRPSCFSDRPEKHKTWQRTMRSCFLSSCVKLRSAVSEKISNMSQPIRGRGDHLVFPIGPKNIYLIEADEIMLPVKFRWIPFSGFREVENVSANQRPEQPSCFSDWPKHTNLVEDVEILLPGKFRWILFSGFREEVENVLANQRPGRSSCFSYRSEKQLGRERWDLDSCQVSLNSVQRFQRGSQKCEKLTTDDGQ